MTFFRYDMLNNRSGWPNRKHIFGRDASRYNFVFLAYTSKLVGKTIMSRIVTFRGRVSMKIMASETSEGSIRLPLAFAFSRFSAGQSASRAETTGPGETWPTLMPWFFNCRRMIWTKLVIAHLELE